MLSFSRNVLLTPASQRDHWNARSTIHSSRASDQVVAGSPRGDKNSNKKKKTDRRTPHSLRLDENRVAFSFCDLHSIPEDEPVCQYRQVIKELPRNPPRRCNHAMTSEEVHPIVAQALQQERLLEREGRPNEAKGDTQDDERDERTEHQFMPCKQARLGIVSRIPRCSLAGQILLAGRILRARRQEE